MSAMRTGVLLCSVIAAFCLAAQPSERAATPTRGVDTANIITCPPEDTITPLWKVQVKPEPISIPEPAYPATARKAGIEGKTVIRAVVGIAGNVTDVEVIVSSGNALLDSSAVEAARMAKFRPGSQDGKSVPVRIVLPFRFALASDKGRAPSSGAAGSVVKEDSAAIHERIVRLGRVTSCPEVRLGDPTYDSSNADITPYGRARDIVWREAEPHPLLESILPTTSFMLMQYGHGEGAGYWRVAVTEDRKPYDLERSLSMILRGEGFWLDSSETYAMAKVATLLSYFARRPDTGPPARWLWEGVPANCAFPSVEFLSKQASKETRPDGTREFRVALRCRIDGIERMVTVAFARDSIRKYIPASITSPDVKFHYLMN